MGTFGAQYLACTCPYQRFAPASRLATHSSGPTWFATPLSYDSCIRYTSPLNPAHPPPPAYVLPPRRVLIVFREKNCPTYAPNERASVTHTRQGEDCREPAAAEHVPRGWGREGARSEERAQQRLAPGGRAALPLTRTRPIARRSFSLSCGPSCYRSSCALLSRSGRWPGPRRGSWT